MGVFMQEIKHKFSIIIRLGMQPLLAQAHNGFAVLGVLEVLEGALGAFIAWGEGTCFAQGRVGFLEVA